MNKKLMIEELNRIKSLMGLINESFDWDFANKIVTQEHPKEIYELLLKMFPKQIEVINYQYNDELGVPFAEWRRKIHDIDNWVLEGPYLIDPQKIDMDKETMLDRKRKYDDYVSGKTKKYFRDNISDPRKTDFEKIPPVTLEKDNNSLSINDGAHRVFLAKMLGKPLKSYIWVKKVNNSPYVNDIKKLFNN
jgi:hypothetical protein